MARFRFKPRRRSFGYMVRRARPIIKAATGITLVKRVNVIESTIPDVTSSDFDNPLEVDLLECVETMDEEVESDGSNVADAPLYSRITGIKLECHFVGAAATMHHLRWMLYKKPDGEQLAANLQGATWHSSNDTPTLRELRKYTIAKGMVIVNPSSAVAMRRIFVSKKALARISPLREGDKLTLIVAKTSAGTTCQLTAWGSIYLRANG